jgi:sugar phosphate isomerase/epimerase
MPLCVFPKCFIPSFLNGGTYSVEWWIREMAASVDVNGIELYGPALPASIGERRRLAAIARELGLAIPMYCHTPDFTRLDPDERRVEIDAQKRAIETCADLGIAHCRVLSGQRRPGVPLDLGLDLAADCINELIPFAASARVCLVLENHYKDAHWNHPELAQKRVDFERLLDRIPESPFFGVNFDPSNALVAGDDPVEFLKRVIARVRTLHASDRYLVRGTIEDLRRADETGATGYADMLRHGVIGEGLIDYRAVFAELRTHGFRGWISIENGNDPTKGVLHLQQSAIFLRKMMQAHDLI